MLKTLIIATLLLPRLVVAHPQDLAKGSEHSFSERTTG
jgi:hypothetical protein